MPVYSCYRGHVAEIALEQEGGFILQDLRGRDWYCHKLDIETFKDVNRDEFLLANANEMHERMTRLNKLGVTFPQTECRTCESSSIEELQQTLSMYEDMR